ncbi:DUF6286 domain-containing protein [Glaciihabitans sp. UYNi722]|uniref:DUF6286 domain-containing protein n=1 Tax=Glaciihabitans sp. UYNi722 TaxID=3156344 RepID=UPI0033990270
MTNHDAIYRRVVRRETHSPKAGLAITLAVILILVLAFVAIEAVLALLQQPPLLLAPKAALLATLALPTAVTTPTLIATGAVVGVIGLVILIAALTPGRRADHRGGTERTAMAVDNRAVASALARRASRAVDIDPDQVVVSVSHRMAEVHIQPSSGWPLDRDAIDEAVADELERMNLTPALGHRVIVASKGVVGA